MEDGGPSTSYPHINPSYYKGTSNNGPHKGFPFDTLDNVRPKRPILPIVKTWIKNEP
jgi:hypothetical protein